MMRSHLAAMLYAELELHLAAALYVDAACEDLGLPHQACDVETMRALLSLTPNELVSEYSTSELLRASAAAVIRITLLAGVLKILRRLHPVARWFIERCGSSWRDMPTEPVTQGWAVIGVVLLVLAWAWARSSMLIF